MGVMTLSSWGMFEQNEAINHSYTILKSNLLPAMLFLMLLPNRITLLLRIGPRMILTFFLASFSLFLAFIASFMLFSLEGPDIEIFAPLAGSWMGGTGNMIAVSSAINASENSMGVTMIIDSVDYALWLMFLLMLVPFSSLFNHFTKAKDSVEEVPPEEHCALHFSYRGYFWLLFAALGVSLVSQIGAVFLSQFFASATTWSVILATIAGIGFSFSPLSRIRGIQSTASAMLYLLISLIASRADISFDMGLVHYLFIGITILLMHALLMVFFAKVFRLDLFSISVASLANIGGIASAPILSAAYAQSLVGIGVLMASMGYIIGTFLALLLSEALGRLV